MDTTNRRAFLKHSTTGLIGLGLSAGAASVPRDSFAAEKTKVAVVRNPKAISDRNVVDPKQAALTVEKALLSLTGKMNTREAWTALGVTKTDVVGIKVNCNASGFFLFAHPELVTGLAESLSSVIPITNIIVYDRSDSELTRAGFTINADGPGMRCYSTEHDGAYHPQEALTRIVTDRCTKLINMPSLKTFDGGFAGSLFLKNHIGTLPRADMSRCHSNKSFCPEVCARPSIKAKTILAFCDGLRGTYTRSEPWYFGGVIASRDQIAAECAALGIINEKRAAEKLPAFDIPPYVTEADTKYKLGTASAAKIDVARVEM
jgi:uncharacterized protein (DUF362 family)